ncbi:MAG: redox-sensing transcriptional repressor Rex [Planctomycetes bacterium]|nr:redox-sensing transcriptional repressor Rex [Planctomycetota bacterium]
MRRSGRNVSDLTIGRLTLYRRLLHVLCDEGITQVFSHQLAAMAGRTAAQVRRDLMAVGYSGSPNRGYEVGRLLASLRDLLDAPGGQNVALVGVGNLGKALLSYFAGRRPNLRIIAAFDNDANKANRVINGCRCYSAQRLGELLRAKGVGVAIIAVPAAAAQDVADGLVAAGVRGILNFAPVRLRVPPGVHVEDLDMTLSLEKAAYLARQAGGPPEAGPGR